MLFLGSCHDCSHLILLRHHFQSRIIVHALHYITFLMGCCRFVSVLVPARGAPAHNMRMGDMQPSPRSDESLRGWPWAPTIGCPLCHSHAARLRPHSRRGSCCLAGHEPHWHYLRFNWSHCWYRYICKRRYYRVDISFIGRWQRLECGRNQWRRSELCIHEIFISSTLHRFSFSPGQLHRGWR